MNYIDLRILENNWYILLTEINYFYKAANRIIPIDFYFNGGSIPRLFWWLCHPLLMPYLQYFAIHDRQYSKKCEYTLTRNEADLLLLYNICTHNKLLWIVVYIAVRVFWFFHFKKDLPFEKNSQTIDKIKIKNII